MFRVCFWLWTRIKTILPLINRLINNQWSSAGCWPRINHIVIDTWSATSIIITCCFSSLTWFARACRFQSLSPGAGVLVWFSCSQGWKWTVYILWSLAAQTVAATHLSSCWWLLLSSAPRVRKITELLWHDSRLHTRRGLPTDQTSFL